MKPAKPIPLDPPGFSGRAAKLLFVCSRNQKRSLTAERVFSGRPGFQVRSAGTEENARIRVSAGLIGWADVILTMEKRHTSILEDRYGDLLAGKTLACLHIPDEFESMDEALISALEHGVATNLEKFRGF